MFKQVHTMKSYENSINDLTFTDYYLRLNLLARSVFEWHNLPNNISEKWIERYLFNEGQCVFFEDEALGFTVAKCTPSGNVNHYNEPTIIQIDSTEPMLSGKKRENFVNCVVIQNNDLVIPTMPTIKLYAYRLADITRTSDINISAQKTPIMITGTSKKILSLKTMFRQVQNNEKVVYVDSEGGIPNSVNVFKTDAPVVFPELRAEKNHIWCEVMTFLGINNANTDKRERLVDDEVQANNEQIQLSAYVMLKARQEACERINKMFKTNISVSIRKFETDEIQAIQKGITGGNNE